MYLVTSEIHIIQLFVREVIECIRLSLDFDILCLPNSRDLSLLTQFSRSGTVQLFYRSPVHHRLALSLSLGLSASMSSNHLVCHSILCPPPSSSDRWIFLCKFESSCILVTCNNFWWENNGKTFQRFPQSFWIPIFCIQHLVLEKTKTKNFISKKCSSIWPIAVVPSGGGRQSIGCRGLRRGHTQGWRGWWRTESSARRT